MAVHSRGPWFYDYLPDTVDDFVGDPETDIQGDKAAVCGVLFVEERV